MGAEPQSLREFIRASVDDVIFLRQARDALVTHPLVTADFAAVDSAMFRVMAIVAVAAVDRILEAWKGVPFLGELNASGMSNGEKIQLLRQCLVEVGEPVDEETVADYLAVKYLRNVFAHVGWKERQRQYIEERGFPIDLREFDHRDWQRMLESVSGILKPLVRAVFRYHLLSGEDDPFLGEVTDILIALDSRPSDLVSRLVSSRDLVSVWRMNLGTISYWISRNMVDLEVHAGKLYDVALDSWNGYLNATVYASGVSQAMIDESLATLEQLHSLELYPRVPIIGAPLDRLARDRDAIIRAARLDPVDAELAERALMRVAEIARQQSSDTLQIWSNEVPLGCAEDVLPVFLSLPPEISRRDVVRALRVGYQLHESCVDSVPVAKLFLERFPRLVPERRTQCLEVGRLGWRMRKVVRAWYTFVEGSRDYLEWTQQEACRNFEQLIRDLEAG